MKPLSPASIRLFPYFARRAAPTIDRYLLLTDTIVAGVCNLPTWPVCVCAAFVRSFIRSSVRPLARSPWATT